MNEKFDTMKNSLLKAISFCFVAGFASVGCVQHTKSASATAPKQEKMIIYQVMTRLFGNDNLTNVYNGTIAQNGVGKFADFTQTALDSLRAFGANYIWYTGVIAHASKTDYTAYGIPSSHPGVVKGNAGSPYAIRDYYDVDPDLASDVNHRMEEFEALIARTHKAGLKVILDFIPNHVAREYHSISLPKGAIDLGANDDKTVAFSANNNFYYLPGESLAPKFEVNGYRETPAKVTGNGVFSATPEKGDWYETIKLNYGIDYSNGEVKRFDPIPDTWVRMKNILLFWSAKGVDAFRADMAEMVPVEFWHWAIAEVKKNYPNLIFIAEIYNPTVYSSYIDTGGFDYLYDKVGLYDTLKAVVQGRTKTSAIRVNAKRLEKVQSHLVNFLENHDEQRIASPDFAGSAKAGRAMTLVSALYTSNPYLLYFGQELGELGKGATGFGGDDGRTTIFDYYGLASLKQWRSGGTYTGEQLPDSTQALRAFYKRVLHIATEQKAMVEGETYDFTADNRLNADYDADHFFAFARYTDTDVIVVAVNLSSQPVSSSLNVSSLFFEQAGLVETDYSNAVDLLTNRADITVLTSKTALSFSLPPYSGKVLKYSVENR